MKWRATKILKEQGDEKTQLIRYSIAGFTNDFNSDWHKQVQEVFQERHKVHDPYVRAMLGFLTEKYEPESSCDYVLKETDLDVKVSVTTLHISWYQKTFLKTGSRRLRCHLSFRYKAARVFEQSGS